MSVQFADRKIGMNIYFPFFFPVSSSFSQFFPVFSSFFMNISRVFQFHVFIHQFYLYFDRVFGLFLIQENSGWNKDAGAEQGLGAAVYEPHREGERQFLRGGGLFQQGPFWTPNFHRWSTAVGRGELTLLPGQPFLLFFSSFQISCNFFYRSYSTCHPRSLWFTALSFFLGHFCTHPFAADFWLKFFLEISPIVMIVKCYHNYGSSNDLPV